MCPTAKLRGAAMGTRSEDESVAPRPLERRVGPVDGETTLGTEGFGFWFLNLFSYDIEIYKNDIVIFPCIIFCLGKNINTKKHGLVSKHITVTFSWFRYWFYLYIDIK